ncbi:MAG: hypothetical protein OXC26_08785 [Albidovulum sp.]|nr:hypothetical protein [Albidovulum sp.]
MRYLTLCERDTVGVGQGRPLSEHEADGIAKLADRMPKGSLAWERRALRFGPFCGVLRTSELTIELLPKIERGASTPAGSRGLLVAMLASTGRLRFSRIGDADLGRQNLHLLDIFIQDFCERVKSALRGGAIATYIATDANLSAIRGRLRLTEHLARNAFDHSRLLCRFDERTVDNAFNRALKHVLRALLSHALAPSTRAGVTSLLHRLHEVTDQRVRPSDLDALRFDRTNDYWRNAFQQARWLLDGMFPDVRTGDSRGSALLFNMERLFEEVLGEKIRRATRTLADLQLRVELQSAQRRLATEGFLLRPDIAVFVNDRVEAILDAKWKHLRADEPHADVSSADAYQMNAYAGRYGCRQLTLVYPASAGCAPGLVRQFRLQTPLQPILDVVAVDLHELAFGSRVPLGLEGMFAGIRTGGSAKERAQAAGSVTG